MVSKRALGASQSYDLLQAVVNRELCVLGKLWVSCTLGNYGSCSGFLRVCVQDQILIAGQPSLRLDNDVWLHENVCHWFLVLAVPDGLRRWLNLWQNIRFCASLEVERSILIDDRRLVKVTTIETHFNGVAWVRNRDTS